MAVVKLLAAREEARGNAVSASPALPCLCHSRCAWPLVFRVINLACSLEDGVGECVGDAGVG